MQNNVVKNFKIAVTGSIACGKSLVKSILDEQNIPTIDADDIVHSLFKDNTRVIKQLTNIFSDEILLSANEINRKKLGEIVFNDKAKKSTLESIIHPEVYNKILEFLNLNKNRTTASIIPLLFETKRAFMFDSIWVVTATEEQQIERLKQRNGLTKEEAILRINSQMSQEEKIMKASIVIDNSGSIENTKRQVLKGLEKFL